MSGLLGLDAVNREVLLEAGGKQEVLVGARGFQDNAFGGKLDEIFDQSVDAFGRIFEGFDGRVAGDGQVEPEFAHVDPCVAGDTGGG